MAIGDNDIPRTERRILGGAAKRIRELQRLKLAEVADRATISESFLSRIENGHRQAPLGTMLALATALNVDLSDITYLSTVVEISNELAAS